MTSTDWMVGREEPGLFPLRPDQTRIGLEIQHGDFFGSRQTEQRSLYGHKKSKPFFVARMTEYGKLRLVRPRMLRLCAVSILYIYHMNKEHWITAALDGSAPEDEIKILLAMSYDLTAMTRAFRKNTILP